MPELFAITFTIALAAVLALLALSARKASSTERSELTSPVRRGGVAVLDPISAAGTVRIPRSFLGISAEYQAVPAWAGRNGLFERVLSLLRPREGGPLLLRIGGDSADRAFWDPHGSRPPSWAVRLTPAWLRSTNTLVRSSGSRLILDLNLVTGSPGGDARWARAAQRGLPRGSIAGYEIGNEPDIYNRRAWLANTLRASRDGSRIPREITSADYDREFRAYARALSRVAPGAPLAGPALAHPAADAGWISNLLAAPHAGLRDVTAHVYPLSACARPGSHRYPTIARMLGARSAAARARALAPAVIATHRAGLAYRITELNSVTCGGLAGVSNSFATALWAPQALFELARAGVDGVNLHIRADKINGAFALDRAGLAARPLLYGLILFERTLGPDARLVRAGLHARSGSGLEAWVVRVGRRGMHVLLINTSRRPVSVDLGLPAVGPVTVERLLAPAVGSTSGVTLGGQRLGADGRWLGRPTGQTIAPHGGAYNLTVPRASAALVGVQLSATGGANA